MPTDPTSPTPGRSLVTKRAVVDVVRAATLGSYGVTGLTGGGPLAAIAERLGLGPRGIRVRFGTDGGPDGGPAGSPDGAPADIIVELDLLVAHGLPIAEVARQVDSAVRYAIRRALGREVARLTIHVGGLHVAHLPPDGRWAEAPGGEVRRAGRARRKAADAPPIAPDDLAASGTDVA